MKKMMLILFLLPRLLLSPAPIADFVILQTEPLNNYEAIWYAVTMVESGGRSDAFCIDINGLPSVGLAQIQQSRVSHFNRLTGHSYKLSDCFDPEISKQVFLYFANRIGNEDKLIRAWNGNINSQMTYNYLQKVKKYL